MSIGNAQCAQCSSFLCCGLATTNHFSIDSALKPGNFANKCSRVGQWAFRLPLLNRITVISFAVRRLAAFRPLLATRTQPVVMVALTNESKLKFVPLWRIISPIEHLFLLMEIYYNHKSNNPLTKLQLKRIHLRSL